MYRDYENPNQLEKLLAEANEQLACNPDDESIRETVDELSQRLNFAYQDEYQEE